LDRRTFWPLLSRNKPNQSYWLSAYDVASTRWNEATAGAVEVTPSALPFDLDQSFRWHRRHHAPYADNRGSRLMPIDIIVVALIAAAFAIFAATLYWADLRTRGLSK